MGYLDEDELKDLTLRGFLVTYKARSVLTVDIIPSFGVKAD